MEPSAKKLGTDGLLTNSRGWLSAPSLVSSSHALCCCPPGPHSPTRRADENERSSGMLLVPASWGDSNFVS